MKKLFAALGIAGSAALVCGVAQAAPTLTFTASATQIGVGDSVSIDVNITGLGADILSAYDVNFVYNPGVLAIAQDSQFGNGFGQAQNSRDATTNGNLAYDLTSLEDDSFLEANQPNELFLFRFRLTGSADGFTNFTLGPNLDFDRSLLGAGFASLNTNIGSICIAVGTGSCTQVIPEPATFGLAGLALAGALLPAAIRRRKAAK
jgi:hypothetical protein